MQIQQDLIHDGITGPFPVAYDAGFGGFMITNCFSKPVKEKQHRLRLRLRAERGSRRNRRAGDL